MRGAPLVDVVIEIPRGSFLKRGSTGRVDFVSPLPCPFNYGPVPQTHRGMTDHKLVCADEPIDDRQQRAVLRFFRMRAFAKGTLNLLRGADWRGPTMPF